MADWHADCAYVIKCIFATIMAYLAGTVLTVFDMVQSVYEVVTFWRVLGIAIVAGHLWQFYWFTGIPFTCKRRVWKWRRIRSWYTEYVEFWSDSIKFVGEFWTYPDKFEDLETSGCSTWRAVTKAHNRINNLEDSIHDLTRHGYRQGVRFNTLEHHSNHSLEDLAARVRRLELKRKAPQATWYPPGDHQTQPDGTYHGMLS